MSYICHFIGDSTEIMPQIMQDLITATNSHNTGQQ